LEDIIAEPRKLAFRRNDTILCDLGFQRLQPQPDAPDACRSDAQATLPQLVGNPHLTKCRVARAPLR
jgi:hypothetical protein